MKSKTDYSLRKFRIQTPKAITFLLLFFMLGGPIVFTACQPKTCPANSTQQFNRKRARYSMINHMRRRGGKGHKQRKSKHRKPEYGFFQTRLKKKQFKHQTK